MPIGTQPMDIACIIQGLALAQGTTTGTEGTTTGC
jgi:hypothetical protein